MKKKACRFLTSFFLLTVMAFASFISAEPISSEQAAALIEKKTLNRWPDPVVADCGLFSSLLGKKIEYLRVYAYYQGSFHPIPFQIDERDAQGNRVFTSGEKANPLDADGLLNKKEELVFMARDSGHRVKPEVFAPGVELWEEVELVDPLSQEKGWVYLLYSETKPPPLSSEDYITTIPKYECEGEGACNMVKSRYMEDHLYPLEP